MADPEQKTKRPVAVEIGARIREQRDRLKLSQGALADKIGARDQTVSRYEQGHLIPSAEALGQLSDALGVSMSWLLRGHESDAAAESPEDRHSEPSAA